jgi:hypothetical protein
VTLFARIRTEITLQHVLLQNTLSERESLPPLPLLLLLPPPPHLQWKRLESSSLQLPSIKMAMIWLIRGPAAAAAASLSHIAASS